MNSLNFSAGALRRRSRVHAGQDGRAAVDSAESAADAASAAGASGAAATAGRRRGAFLVRVLVVVVAADAFGAADADAGRRRRRDGHGRSGAAAVGHRRRRRGRHGGAVLVAFVAILVRLVVPVVVLVRTGHLLTAFLLDAVVDAARSSGAGAAALSRTLDPVAGRRHETVRISLAKFICSSNKEERFNVHSEYEV